MCEVGSNCLESNGNTPSVDCARHTGEERLFRTGASVSISRWLPFHLAKRLGSGMLKSKRWPRRSLALVGPEDVTLDGQLTVACNKYSWTGKWGGSHSLWVSQEHGLPIREEQVDEGGAVSSYPGQAVVEVFYDLILEDYLIKKPPLELQVF